jgi:hypothetical protein
LGQVRAASPVYAVERATVRQRKTGRPVRFELTDRTRQAIDDCLRASGKKPASTYSTVAENRDKNPTTRQYARLIGHARRVQTRHQRAESPTYRTTSASPICLLARSTRKHARVASAEWTSLRCVVAPPCRLWVKRVGFVMSPVCPVYPKQQTFPDPVGTSHLCHERK